MADVKDVANYILRKFEGTNITAMKLQKLLYYCQAWSLTWDEQPMFIDRIEAWSNGPVIPSVFDMHRGKYIVTEKDFPGNPENLSALEKETIDIVISYYGDKTSLWLSQLSHAEKPWQDAREGVPLGSRCSNEITHDSMANYYQSISLH